MLRIKLVKSTVGHNWRNRRTVQALGLRKPHQVVEHDDTPSIRGMIHHVRDLLHVEEIPGDPTPRKGATPPAPVVVEEVAAPKPKRTPKPKVEKTEEEK
jgi:large subunit ribosomal protein L30